MKININENEALRYLGCKNFDENSCSEVRECINLLETIITPRWTYGVFNTFADGYGVKILGGDIYFKSRDLSHLLSKSEKSVIIGVTLGVETDKLISLYQKTNISKGVVIDACASAAVEGLCEYVIDQIKIHENVKYLTRRFSPGYGDLDINYQKTVLSMINAYKKIGLTANESMILTPIKSVTAFCGITNEPYLSSWNGCMECSNYENCQFRKNGNICKD